jgi:transcriptional regulator GlxA family with amidase domain
MTQFDADSAALALPSSIALALEQTTAAAGDERPAWSRPQGGLPNWRLKRVLAFIDDNIGGDITLKQLAEVACLSPHHFSELFRRSTGVSPYRYVMERRIACAKVLLRDSMLGVLDVALAVGFSDQSHFTKVFRRTTGLPPGAYRAAA